MYKTKSIPGYEGIYSINEYGEIFTTHNRNGVKHLKQYKKKNGYVQVVLVKNKVKSYVSIHRLVATVFLENDKHYKQVNHKDGNKENNHVSNLEWCSISQNMIHAYKNGLNSRSKPVSQYTKDNVFIKRYYSTREACRITGIHSQSIGGCALNNGKNKTAGGYIWRYDATS